MSTIRGVLTVIAIFFISYCQFVTESFADMHSSASCSYEDVSSAIAAASLGDTVSVPAGSCTWSSTLSITKGINLIGAGIGSTVIRRAGSFLIGYDPANYTLNQPFRLSGFSFDGAGGDILKLGHEMYPTAAVEQTNVRVDHNRFYSSVACTLSQKAIEHYGNMFGVVDNNMFENFVYPMRNQSPAGYALLWDPAIDGVTGYHLLVPGSIYNLYFEDNTISLAFANGEAALTNSQYSGRYAYRYNNIIVPAGGQSWWLFDVHGYQMSEMHSPFGSENYGNRLTTNGSSIGYLHIRGGVNLAHHNSSTTAVSYAGGGSATSCPPAKYIPYQPIHDSYFFQNRTGYTGSLAGAASGDGTTYSCGGYNRPLMGKDFFDDVNSTPAVSCGTTANRPTTCSVGQGYWATTQSCSDLTGMVGVNPSTPISGTLYKCTATNTWIEFYTPYTYPHPLRGEVGGISPPKNIKIIN